MILRSLFRLSLKSFLSFVPPSFSCVSFPPFRVLFFTAVHWTAELTSGQHLIPHPFLNTSTFSGGTPLGVTFSNTRPNFNILFTFTGRQSNITLNREDRNSLTEEDKITFSLIYPPNLNILNTTGPSSSGSGSTQVK